MRLFTAASVLAILAATGAHAAGRQEVAQIVGTPGVWTPGGSWAVGYKGVFTPSGAALGAPLSITVSSTQLSSTTDLTPVSQFTNGWTADVVMNGLSPAGVTSAYGFGSHVSPTLAFTVSSPGYDSTASAIRTTRTIRAWNWLRQTAGAGVVGTNYLLPTEAANGGNAKLAVVLDQIVYQSDIAGSGTSTSGFYTGAAAATNIPLSISSTVQWPRPIFAWVNPPGERIGSGQDLVVEGFGGQSYGMGGQPLAAVVYTVTDGTHSVSKTVSSMTKQSSRLLSTSCTATTGSNVLTACGSTVGFIVGERLTVPGLPGQPRILSIDSATQMTLGVSVSMTPTTLGGVTIATEGAGEALADGALAGAKITNPNLGDGTTAYTITVPSGTVATVGTTSVTLGAPSSGQWAVGMWITGTNIQGADATHNGSYIVSQTSGTTGGAGVYVVSQAATGTGAGTATGDVLGGAPGSATVTTARVSTSATTGTASAATGTIQHTFQGTTGTVTVTAGVPVPVWRAVFTSSDLSGASMADGQLSVQAQAYPVLGDVVLDTRLGADGTGCDWFYANSGTVNGPTCGSTNAAYFGSTGLGTDVAAAWKTSVNTHNLAVYLDTAGSYAPVYAWVSGTAGGAPAVSTSSADPGSAAYYATVSAAMTAVKTYNNANRSHNDANDAVVCITAAGSPYAGFGGSLAGLLTASKPGYTMTSVTGGGACPATGTVNANLAVTLNHSATAANLNPGANFRIANLTISGSSGVVQGATSGVPNGFPANWGVFDRDAFVTTGSPVVSSIGAAWYYNVMADQSAANGNLFAPFSTGTAATAVYGSTEIGGTYTTSISSGHWIYTALGNIGVAEAIVKPSALATSPNFAQPISTTSGYNKWMASNGNSGQYGAGGSSYAQTNNILWTHNIVECINHTTGPCLQISADNTNVPLANIYRTYDTVIGQRSNNDYVEGIALTPTVVASGGTFAGGVNYHFQVVYALASAPGTETSTDGCSEGVTGTCSSFAPVANGSLTFSLPDDPKYVAYVYLGTANDMSNACLATVSGADAAQLAMGKTYTITNIGATCRQPYSVATAPNGGHNEPKFSYFMRFNIDENFNIKTDTYNGSGAYASGSRVGNWQGVYRVDWIGNVAVTGTVINSGYGPLTGLGMQPAWFDTYNPTNSPTDLSWVVYRSDRSSGANNSKTYPSINTGMGAYDIPTGTNVNTVPSGYAAWPRDITGCARLNDGTGFAGAYEKGCF